MKARIDLKPCPFCGNKSVDMVKGLVASITMFSCRKCKALTSFQGKSGCWSVERENKQLTENLQKICIVVCKFSGFPRDL